MEVWTPSAFLPAQYSADSELDSESRLVRIGPFRRDVFVSQHRAYQADFEMLSWILRYGSTDFWYEKPSRPYLKNITGPEGLLHIMNARPVSLETPKVWAARALLTPTDDDIFDCSPGHMDNSTVSACHQCTAEKSDALDNTPLVYYVVFSTCQASEPFIHGAHFNGCQIYKLMKFGSREAAAAEVFYSAGVNGWSTVFSCAMRLDEDFDSRIGKVKRADELWELAEHNDEEDTVRVFF